MKQFLVLVAVLPIMLIIMVEFSLNTIVNTKVEAVDDIVYTYKEKARQDGTFAYVINDMKEEIAKVVNVNVSEIKTDGTYIYSTPIYRLQSMSGVSSGSEDSYFIHYVVKVPIKEMKSLGSLLKTNSDRYYYTIDSYLASERLP